MHGMGWDTAHLVGNSLGGWLALALAERGRVQTVMAFSTAGAYDDQRAYVRLTRLLRAMQTGPRYGAPIVSSPTARPKASCSDR